MTKVCSMLLGALLLVIGSASTAAAETMEMDAQLGTSRGGRTTLSGFRGKPVVLFFEDRDSPDLNKDFKDRLFALGQRHDLLTAAHVVAVANLAPFDFFPAREFALAAVRKEEARWGIPILIDWRGVLSDAPWKLPKDTSSVVLLDRQGRIVYQRSGRLSPEAQERFFAELAGLLGVELRIEEARRP